MAASAGRRWFLIGAGALHFLRRDPAVTVLVVLQNELIRFVDELAAGDLSILVFVKVTEVRVGEGGPGLADSFKFGWIEMAVAVAIGQGKEPVQVILPLVAGIDAIVIGVPDVGSARRRDVFCWPRAVGGVAGWRLCRSIRCGRKEQTDGNAYTAKGRRA